MLSSLLTKQSSRKFAVMDVLCDQTLPFDLTETGSRRIAVSGCFRFRLALSASCQMIVVDAKISSAAGHHAATRPERIPSTPIHIANMGERRQNH